MFGYVRPLKGELKVSEYELFKAVYCGLCHTLGRRYGLPSRFVLSYDLTFFATVITALSDDFSISRSRCIASPFRKKCTACTSSSSELAADLTVLLAYFKLEDEIKDKKGLSKLPALFFTVLLRPFYKRARRFRPQLSEKIKKSLENLSQLEREKAPSIDRTADTFAVILSDAVGDAGLDEKTSRILQTMFYHIGRWIYIIDACDDYTEDIEKKQYNPIAYRYELSDSTLPESIKSELEITISHSLACAASAYELIDWKNWEGLVGNVVYKGLYAVTAEVLSGNWQRRRKANERPL
jgi:hypothetical protein